MEFVLYKVGGSLLNWAEFPGCLRAVLQRQVDEQSAERPVLLVGGGTAADVVRSWDRCFQLGEEAAHQLALTSMELTARLVSELLPETELWLPPGEWIMQPQSSTSSAKGEETLQSRPLLQPPQLPGDFGRTPVLLAHAWIAALEPQAAVPLPHHWGCTSDSIALWLAWQLGISRLILVKSVSMPASQQLADWADAGLIDTEFPRLHAAISRLGLPPAVEWINLRESLETGSPCRPRTTS